MKLRLRKGMANNRKDKFVEASKFRGKTSRETQNDDFTKKFNNFTSKSFAIKIKIIT